MRAMLKAKQFADLLGRFATIAAILLVVAMPACAQSERSSGSAGQERTVPASEPAGDVSSGLTIISTSGPRATFASFLRLSADLEAAVAAYKERPNRANFAWARQAIRQFSYLFDLREVPRVQRSSVARDTVGQILDTLQRLELPALSEIPDRAAMAASGHAGYWRIPGTGLTIARMKSGSDEGEYLFTARTIAQAPFYFRQVRGLPPVTKQRITNWRQTLLDLHGPVIPAGLVSSLPGSLHATLFGVPVWKLILAGLLIVSAIIAVSMFYRLFHPASADEDLRCDLRRMCTPMLMISVTWVVKLFIQYQVVLPGNFMHPLDLLSIAVMTVAAAWLLWLAGRAVSEAIIRSPRIPDESLDAELLRMMTKILGFCGAIALIGLGAHLVGIPAFGVVAGLGVGGIAVALAIRPTLENLFGGIILYLDRPVSVGDFCTFGDHTGTVERIGPRSTQIRALDRTVISVPNSLFADMNITNWARCDRMLIEETLGLRYETKPDQLRFVLAKVRELCVSHPKIDNDTVRVRFVDYGASSLDINLRIFALTTEWNEFFAIREDVLLRIADVVEESGSGFAFPSQTLYFGRDDGLDGERTEAAVQEVEAWRRAHRLPFPTMPSAEQERLQNTLDYPPHGSSWRAAAVQEAEGAEALSLDPVDEDTPEEEKKE